MMRVRIIYFGSVCSAGFESSAAKGHDLEKGTWLLGDLPTLSVLERHMTKQNRKMIADRLQKRSTF